MKEIYDVIIIGGGPGGLSAALTLARGNRSVCILDEGIGRNAPAAHMMNFPSRDGTSPNEFRRLIREDLIKYEKVKFIKARVTSLARKDERFIVNNEMVGKKILLAHGVKDTIPDIAGFLELFGKAIFHCPYCHGYEHRDEPMGLIANEKVAEHMVPLVRGLSHDLILFTNGAEYSSLEKFENQGIKVYTSKISSLVRNGEKLIAVKLASGEEIPRSYLFNRFDQTLTSDLGTKLGCELSEFGLYKVDGTGMTTEKGIYAAGDIVDPRQSVIMACASGSMTGAQINFALLSER